MVLLTHACLPSSEHPEVEEMPPVSGEDTELVQDGKLNRADCLCPICLEIFLEPVTLPCSHTFCKPCFLETVDKANICCPLCRKRVSTWARLNGRNKTLVNAQLWRRIQDTFPTQCQHRLNGVDEEEDVNSKFWIIMHRFLRLLEIKKYYSISSSFVNSVQETPHSVSYC